MPDSDVHVDLVRADSGVRLALDADDAWNACRRLLTRADADLDAAVNLLVAAFDARYLSGEPISETWIERILAVVWTRNEAFPCARPA